MVLLCFVLLVSVHLLPWLNAEEALPLTTTEMAPVTPPLVPGAPYFVEAPYNATVLVDQNFTMPCRIQGNGTVKVTWYRYYEPYRKKGLFHRILKSGNLRFKRIRVSDQAYWYCVGKNSFGSVKSKYAYLRVHAPATIIEGPSNKRVTEGTIVSMTCFVAGDPEPKITWKVNGVTINDTYTGKVFTKEEYRFNATTTTVVECVAQNSHVHGNTSVTRNATVYVIETPRGYCKPYEGRMCSPHVGSRLVWYDLKTPTNESDTRELSLPAQFKRIMQTVGEACREPIEALVCETMFPECVNDTKLPRMKPVCQEHCRAIESYFCLPEYKKLLSEPLFDDMFLPQCTTLPGLYDNKNSNRGNSVAAASATFDLSPRQLSSLTTNGVAAKAGPSLMCSKVAIFQVEPSQVTTSCYLQDGRSYAGPVNVTEQHYPCQSWDVHNPHSHPYLTPAFFPALVAAGNRCRNPGGLRARPWCYILALSEHNKTTWQYCDVPACDTNKTAALVEHWAPPVEMFTVETVVIVVFVSVIIVLLLSLIVVLVFCVVRHRRRFNKYNAAAQNDIDIDVEKLQSNHCYLDQSPVLDTVEYPRNDIQFVRDIGRGAFGRVFKAKAPGISPHQEITIVVVKMLKEDADEEMTLNFEQEAALLVELKHPNIIKLLGACAVGKPMCLLFEFMAHGDLTEFLKNCQSDSFHNRSSVEMSTREGDVKLSHGQQLYIGKQICSAMLYLSSHSYVHRDLATRNCLVGEDLLIKLSDFSLTRLVSDPDGGYLGSDDEAKPLRWMPLEAIVYNHFSVKSDVWAFGVVLWEIFAHALQPYFELSHEEMIHYIKEGNILACPDNTPPAVYDLMEDCWAMDPAGRPNFRQIYTEICTLYTEFQ